MVVISIPKLNIQKMFLMWKWIIEWYDVFRWTLLCQDHRSRCQALYCIGSCRCELWSEIGSVKSQDLWCVVLIWLHITLFCLHALCHVYLIKANTKLYMTDKQHSIVHNELVVLNQNRKQKKYREWFISCGFCCKPSSNWPNTHKLTTIVGFCSMSVLSLLVLLYVYTL